MTYDALKVHIEYIRAALERGEKRMERIEGSIAALPCSVKIQPCPTQTQVQLPVEKNDPQATKDQTIGWVVRKGWTSIPHAWRFALVFFGGGLTLGEVISWLKHLLS